MRTVLHNRARVVDAPEVVVGGDDARGGRVFEDDGKVSGGCSRCRKAAEIVAAGLCIRNAGAQVHDAGVAAVTLDQNAYGIVVEIVAPRGNFHTAAGRSTFLRGGQADAPVRGTDHVV